ncbi:hypothetical protein Mgra_00003717 [Meloidogyne graminicola]|uniref:Uncharacterized protein n=1 Tax=Meloidogyne graminicola TaxID=189291 RepID=A0A8S9ZUV6_9BILA|nr:hypothetical protein Mgra_00003717 [Meloidogyne graminicola]
MTTLNVFFILFLFPINCKVVNEINNAKIQALNLQAKARLSSCHHGVGVLLWEGYNKLNSSISSHSGGQTELEVVEADHLKEISATLQQSILLLKDSYNKNTQPSTKLIIDCINLYIETYQEVQSNISSVIVPKTDNQITSSIGMMMREISSLIEKINN